MSIIIIEIFPVCYYGIHDFDVRSKKLSNVQTTIDDGSAYTSDKMALIRTQTHAGINFVAMTITVIIDPVNILRPFVQQIDKLNG